MSTQGEFGFLIMLPYRCFGGRYLLGVIQCEGPKDKLLLTNQWNPLSSSDSHSEKHPLVFFRITVISFETMG
jgi:hypothetical protein